jgi:hypothetical protein
MREEPQPTTESKSIPMIHRKQKQPTQAIADLIPIQIQRTLGASSKNNSGYLHNTKFGRPAAVMNAGNV